MPTPDRLRIVVVEDDPLIGMLLRQMLETLGHDVRAVETTEADAVAAAARETPDLMIVDARLGRGSGVSALKTILAQGHVPHILMSGAPISPPCAQSVLLDKPFVEQGLVRAIERAVERS